MLIMCINNVDVGFSWCCYAAKFMLGFSDMSNGLVSNVVIDYTM